MRSAKIHEPDTLIDSTFPQKLRFGLLSTVPARTLMAASLLTGLVYPFVETSLQLAGTVLVKGLGAGLLAVAVTLLAAPQRWWLAAIMAARALGDILFNIPSLFLFGAGAFAIGHVIAVVFYLRSGRNAGLYDRLAPAALVAYGLAMPALVSPAGTPVDVSMLYSVLLCGMTATLLLSRFSRVAFAGALLFVASDTLLIMGLGGHLVGGAYLHGLMIWFAYYSAQAMIFFGVATGLGKR